MNYPEIVKHIAEEVVGTLESGDGVESAVDVFMEGLTTDVQEKAEELAGGTEMS